MSRVDGIGLAQVDDDEIARIMAERLVDVVKADVEASRTLGATLAEACGVLGELSALAARGVPTSRVLLILDQYLDYDEGSLIGIDMCRTLRERLGWGGLIVMRSANDEPSAQAEYLAAGADGSVGKDLISPREEAAYLAKLYHARYGST